MKQKKEKNGDVNKPDKGSEKPKKEEKVPDGKSVGVGEKKTETDAVVPLAQRMKILEEYRNRIFIRQGFLIIPIMVLILTILYLIASVSCLTSESCIIINPHIKNSVFVIPGITKRICEVITFLLLLLFVAYGTYHVIKKFRRYQSALNRLNLLIIRLKLYTDKDLIISSRIDRELEMIYRILES